MTRAVTRTHAVVDSPVGQLTVVLDDAALVGLYFPGHLRRPPAEGFGPQQDASADLTGQLAEYFAGDRTTFDLRLALHGNAFQLTVWAMLQRIPYGETRSYGDLARELGDRNAAQAVGHANALNPISIVVPCHRVVGADGSLTGYAGGIENKRFLLDLESPGSRLF